MFFSSLSIADIQPGAAAEAGRDVRHRVGVGRVRPGGEGGPDAGVGRQAVAERPLRGRRGQRQRQRRRRRHRHRQGGQRGRRRHRVAGMGEDGDATSLSLKATGGKLPYRHAARMICVQYKCHMFKLEPQTSSTCFVFFRPDSEVKTDLFFATCLFSETSLQH